MRCAAAENFSQLCPSTSAAEDTTFVSKRVSSAGVVCPTLRRVSPPFCLNESRSSSCALTVLVFADETCCPDPPRGRVSVGLGDSCCGAVPYSTRGGQLCCGGSLHDGYGVQCCGGRVVDEKLVCCGDAERGEVHSYVPGEGCKETQICSDCTCKYFKVEKL